MESEAKSFTIVAVVFCICVLIFSVATVYYVNTSERDIQVEAIKAGLHQEVLPGSVRSQWVK